MFSLLKDAAFLPNYVINLKAFRKHGLIVCHVLRYAALFTFFLPFDWL